ncbi:MAG: ABC transporter substrate-binding protein [Deltaproteobacteria bacterium]|nr:ABC transporter substrate-binding protein [Candidatus Anaeroferrophillacea bacterium]
MGKQTKSIIFLLSVVLLAILLVVVVPAGDAVAGASPREQLQSSIDRILEVLRQRQQEAGATVDLDALADRLFHERFDMDYTTRLCLGRYWRDLDDGKRGEFVTTFAELLKSTYIGRVEEYSGEVVSYGRERIEGEKAMVETVIVSKGVEIPLDYKMVLRDGYWYVYDVIIEEVSLVRNYRSQFNSFLEKQGIADLLQRLREKIAENEAARRKNRAEAQQG